MVGISALPALKIPQLVAGGFGCALSHRLR